MLKTNTWPSKNLEEHIRAAFLDEETIVLADGFEEAFIGIGRQFTKHPIAVYSKRKCIDILCKNMSREEAEEYFDYNVQGAFIGDQTPLFVE